MIATNKVACFYTELKNNEENKALTKQCFQLIDYWGKSWEANGWDAYVLTEDDIEKDEYYFALKFDKFHKSFLCKHTIDFHCEYSRSCYLRWLAYYQFAKKHGEIFHADYDAINYGFTPDNDVLVNRVLIGSNSAGKMNNIGGRRILDSFLAVERKEYPVWSIQNLPVINGKQKISDLFLHRNIVKTKVHNPRNPICVAPNLKLFIEYNLHNPPYVIDYHNGIYNKPENENMIDISDILHDENGKKLSRRKAITAIEQHYNIKGY